MGIADCAGAACTVLNLPDRARTSTIESKTDFFCAATGGHITLVSTPVHVG